MNAFLAYEIHNKPATVAKFIVGIGAPQITALGAAPLVKECVPKIAQLLAGQTPTYAGADEQAVSESGRDILLDVLTYYQVTLAPADLAALVADISTQLLARFP